MKKTVFALSLLTIIVIAACTKYRPLPDKYPTPPPPPVGTIGFGTLRINEFICHGTDPTSETYLGGATAKWFEIYNPTLADITLTPGQWFVTDTLGTDSSLWGKYPIPAYPGGGSYKVPSLGFLVICCPSSSTVGGPSPRINTSFSLKSSYGHIGIYYKKSSTMPVVAIDSVFYTFTSNPNNVTSYGRFPDGKGSYILSARSQITCEKPNVN